MIKKLLISSILIAILPKYAIAADIPTINKPYKSSDSGLLATRGALNNVVDRVNENFNVVSDNLTAADSAIQSNREAIVAAQASNAATSASLDNVKQLSKLATFGTVVNAQNTIATNNAVQAVSDNLTAADSAIQSNHEAIVAAQASNAATSASLDNVKQLSKLATFGTVVNAQNTVATNNAVQAVSDNLTAAGSTIQSNHEAIVVAQASNAATSASLDNVKQLSKLATFGTVVNAQNTVATNNAVQAVSDNLTAAGSTIQSNHEAIVVAQASNAATSASLDNVKQLSKLATFGTVVNAQNTVATNNAVQAVSDNLTAAGSAIQTNHEAIVAAQASNAATSASLEHDINAVKDDLNKVGEAIQANHDALANSSGSMDSSYTNDWNNMFKDSINNLQSQIDKNRKLSSRGIAGVAAMTNIPTLTDGSFSIGMGYGYFDGQDAYALGISKSFESGIAVKTSLATSGSKDTTFGVGASYSFR
ncbi:YadA C-terminal domain-containing protein [Aliivibrio sp. S4TY2]|uniref:YadA C-terminal domain-containing protein n=1 Tax=unclassified Aliivibrio TaxID=2645654 RepID=UPI002379E4D6|nr:MULTISPECIES: YadA C-terminal domain-containing protein [unclassified Aliivibrio]MDD9156387.1 YadA C-terminal domain-containing protein [Aliivibrio sp. S4TY2]MDD9202239.1 YadA C-terminal domain-containing protein [Aliivibrio sp. S4MY1]